MNILFINEFQVNENQGGVQRVTKVLSEYLKCRGYFVFFAFFKQSNHEDIISDEYKFSDLKICAKGNIVLLKQILINRNINIIINQFGFSPEVIKLILSSSTSIPFLSVLHGKPDYEMKALEMQLSTKISFKNSLALNLKLFLEPIYKFYFKQRLAHKLRFIYHNSTRTILLSNSFVPFFKQISGIKEDTKLKAINNPISHEMVKAANGKLIKDKSVLFVGRLVKGKRVELLLRIWKEIENSVSSWSLDIVGDGPEYEKLKSLTTSLKIRSVCFHGHRSDVDKYYEKASIFSMLSYYEGFPMVLIEAQLFGVVPIAYNSFESLKEIILDGVTGYIIPDLGKDAYVNKLLEIIREEEKRRVISRNCIQASKNYRIDNIGKEWIELIKSITV